MNPYDRAQQDFLLAEQFRADHRLDDTTPIVPRNVPPHPPAWPVQVQNRSGR